MSPARTPRRARPSRIPRRSQPLLDAVMGARVGARRRTVPVLVKLSPPPRRWTSTSGAVDELVDGCPSSGASRASWRPTPASDRAGLRTAAGSASTPSGAGGLSGARMAARAEALVRHLARARRRPRRASSGSAGSTPPRRPTGGSGRARQPRGALHGPRVRGALAWSRGRRTAPGGAPRRRTGSGSMEDAVGLDRLRARREPTGLATVDAHVRREDRSRGVAGLHPPRCSGSSRRSCGS